MPKTLAYSLSIEFQKDEGGYLAFFPALPGCHTWGASDEEAVKNAEEALRKNGEAIPQKDHPKGEVRSSTLSTLR
jgi:predicted RNase H-like HicB family nuclease